MVDSGPSYAETPRIENAAALAAASSRPVRRTLPLKYPRAIPDGLRPMTAAPLHSSEMTLFSSTADNVS